MSHGNEFARTQLEQDVHDWLIECFGEKAAYRSIPMQDFDLNNKPNKKIEAPELTYVNENYVPLKDSCPILYRIWQRVKRFTRHYNDVH